MITETVEYVLSLKDKDFTKNAKSAGKSLDTIGSKATSMGKSFAPASAAASGFLGVAAKGYMEGETAIRRYETVFKDSVGSMDKYYAKHKDTIALTNNEFKAQAASIGDLLNPMGFASEQTADLTQQVIDLAGAQSSWAGLDFEDTIYRINAAMLGETEGLKALGVKISANDITTKAATMTGEEYAGMTEEQIKALAVLELTTEKSGDAIAAWDEQVENGMGTQERFNVAMRDFRQFMENFGQAIAPGITIIVEALGKMFEALSALPEPVLAVLGAILAIVAVIAPLLLLFGGIASSISAIIGIIPLLGSAFAFLGSAIAFVFSPLGLLIAAIVAAIFIFIKFKDEILAFVDTAITYFVQGLQVIWQALQAFGAWLVEGVTAAFTTIGNIISTAWNFIVGIFSAAFNFIWGIVSAAFSAIVSAFTTVFTIIGNVVSTAWNFISGLFSAAFSFIGGLISGALNLFVGGFTKAFNVVTSVVDTFLGFFRAAGNIISGIVNSILGGIGKVINGIKSIDLNPFDGKSLPTTPDPDGGGVGGTAGAGGNSTNVDNSTTQNINITVNNARGSRVSDWGNARGVRI